MSQLNKLNWKVLMLLLVVALVVNVATSAVLESAGLESWARALVLTIDRLARAGFIILLLLGGFYLVMGGVGVLSKLLPDLFEEKGKETNKSAVEIIPEARNVSGVIDDLGQRLDAIEENRDQAIIKLQDADMLASTLVALIRRTVTKASNLEREGQALAEALEAWVSGDRVAIAKLAGQIDDDHIRSLMLETNGDDSYRSSVLELIATQTGALRSSSRALRELSNAWLGSLTDQRAKTARLSVVVDALDAARPLASINAKLIEAQGYLMMQNQLDLHHVTRLLPASTIHQIEGYK